MTGHSFDPAAASYDAARAFPPGIAELVAAGAVALAPAARTWLEVGVGTGRITRPLLAQSVRVTGLDLSASMLAQLRSALPPGAAPPLVQADAAALPLAAGVADAVVAVHVLQLIANWRTVLAEVRRVLRPGGAFLLGHEWRPPDSPGARLRDQWNTIVRAHGGLPGADPAQADFADVTAALLAQGAALEERAVGEWSLTRTVARQIETIEHRTWSASWPVPADFFPRCLADLRAWATANLGALDTAFTVPHRFIWQRFTWPAGTA
jgi:SAM-dependent methyltransferase